jgi:hypothetical protein
MITHFLAIEVGIAPEERAEVSALKREGALLARYILRSRTIAPTALERYAAGCTRLFRDPAAEEGLAANEFVHRHPWALPFLDAAAALFHPHALLRKKLLLMLSILETMPEHAPTFAPRPRARVHLLGLLLLWVLTSVFKVSAGVVLYPFAERPSPGRRRDDT